MTAVILRTWRAHPRLTLALPAAGLLVGWVAGWVWWMRPWTMAAR